MHSNSITENEIKYIFIKECPELKKYFTQVSINKILSKNISVVEAISRIVIGQMLSRKVSNVIINRAENIAGVYNIALLSETEMRVCGISNSKARAIKLFAEQYFNDVPYYENWRNLESDKLFAEVNKHWGLSNWTASMLAIFYFGFEDVYPVNDGSIKRVTHLLEQKGIVFDPDKAKPFRSYLALYLWEILDKKLIT